MKRDKPNEKELKFINHLISENGNKTKAAILTGYSPKGACSTARNLLKKPYVQAEYDRRLDEIAGKTNVTVERIENEIAKIAFASSKDVFKWDKQKVILADGLEVEKGVVLIKTWNQITEDSLSAIASIKETNQGIEIKMYDKIRALEDLAKIKGAFNDAEIKKVKAIKDTEKLDDKDKLPESGEQESVNSADILVQSNKIFKAVIAGTITPAQGKQLSDMLETQRKTLETVDLENRIKELEKENDD